MPLKNCLIIMDALHQSVLYGIVFFMTFACRKVLFLYSPLTYMASWHFSDGSEDPATTPFLEIADQKGNPIQIPLHEKKVTTVLCFLWGCAQIHLAILLLTKKYGQIPPANCLNIVVIYPCSVTLASHSRKEWNMLFSHCALICFVCVFLWGWFRHLS